MARPINMPQSEDCGASDNRGREERWWGVGWWYSVWQASAPAPQKSRTLPRINITSNYSVISLPLARLLSWHEWLCSALLYSTRSIRLLLPEAQPEDLSFNASPWFTPFQGGLPLLFRLWQGTDIEFAAQDARWAMEDGDEDGQADGWQKGDGYTP